MFRDINTKREEHEPLIDENSFVPHPLERTSTQTETRQEIINQLIFEFSDEELKNNSRLEVDEIPIDKLFFIGKSRLHTEYLGEHAYHVIDTMIGRYQSEYPNDPLPLNANIFDRLAMQDENIDNEFCAQTFCKQNFDSVFTEADVTRETGEGLKEYKDKLKKWEAAETLLQYQVKLVDLLKQRHRNERSQTFYNRDKTKEFEKTLERLENKLIHNLDHRKSILSNWKNIVNIANADKEILEKKITEYTTRITEVTEIIQARIKRDEEQEIDDPSDVVEESRKWNEVLLDSLKDVIDVAKAIKDGRFFSTTWDKIVGFGDYLANGLEYIWNNPIAIPRGIYNGTGFLLYEAQAAIYQLQIWWTSGRLFGPLRLERIPDILGGIKIHADNALVILHKSVMWGGITYLFNFARDFGIVFFVEPLRPVYGAIHDSLRDSKRPWVNYIADELLPEPSRRSLEERKMPLWKQVAKRTWNALVEDGWRKGSKLYNLYNDGLWGILTNLCVILLVIFVPPVGFPLALIKGIINTWAFFGDVQNEAIVAAHDWTDYSFLYFENKERMELQEKTITYLRKKNKKRTLEPHEMILLADLIREKRNCELLQEQLHKNFVAHSAEPSKTFLGGIANSIKAAWASWTSSVVINRLVRVLPGVIITCIGMALFFFVPGGQLPGAILAFVGGSVMTGFTPRVINFFRDEFPKLVEVFKKAGEYASEILEDKVILENNSTNVIKTGLYFPPRTSDSPSSSPITTPDNSNHVHTSSESDELASETSLTGRNDNINIPDINIDKKKIDRKKDSKLPQQSASSEYTDYSGIQTINDVFFHGDQQRKNANQFGSQQQITPRPFNKTGNGK